MIEGLRSYPAVKSAGVSWLGDVPEHWEVEPIARLGQLFKGRGGSKEDEETSGVPCVRYGDLYTRHEFFINSTKAFVSPGRASAYTPIRLGDVLFAASGETLEDIGRSAVNLLDGEAVCGGDIILLRPNENMNPRFLGYAADAPSSRHQKATMGRGFTVVHIYASELKRLVLAIPPLDEQTAIVRFLDHADAQIQRCIRAKQKLIKLLEEEKRAFIHRAVTRGLDPDVGFKSSGVEWLGDLPEHWDVAELRRIVAKGRSITYGIVQPGGYIEGGRPMVRAQDYSFGWARPESVYHVSEAIELPYRRSRLQGGDIVYTIVGQGSVGNVAIVPECFAGANITQTTARISVDPGLAQPQYVAAVLDGPIGHIQLRRRVKGVGQPGINLSHLRLYQIPLPPVEEQVRIAHFVETVMTQHDATIDRAQREMDLLREYRTRLVADVVTGKLDVREAARKPPDATPEVSSLDEIDDVSHDEESAETGEVEAEEAA